MMHIGDLPAGNAPAPLCNPCFPVRWQHFLWRNWGLVKVEKLAGILKCPPGTVLKAAGDMGLPLSVRVNEKWVSRGYLTLIRNNWHLLNYEQMLELLEWTPEKMAYTLKEEDFFWIKLGKLKPAAGVLRYVPLTEEEQKETARIKEIIGEYLTPEQLIRSEEAYQFAELYHGRGNEGKKKEDGFKFNFIHSYAASCGDVLGEADVLDPVPENLMAQYSSMGINGVWFHAILYLLCPIPGAEKFSAGYEKRLENLKKIVQRCKKYGIKIYLYLNEPRTMPEEFYTYKPDWRGREARGAVANCTTKTPEILEYLERSLETIFTAVPDLGGILTITMSENTTNCHTDAQGNECPCCGKFPPEKIIADINGAMERGMHRAAPEAEMIAYDWAWRRTPRDVTSEEFKKAVMELLPKNEHLYVNCVSEWGKTTEVGGVKGILHDYSISQVGPSEEALTTWRNAAELGIGCVAKVQVNNSWELAAVPYIPVPYLIREHLDNLKKAGIKGIMLSWTHGGYPGGNLELLSKTPEECAAEHFSPELAECVCQAWRFFSEGFREFPFSVGTAYNSPCNWGPMNLLHLTPSGYDATMVGFPYDDLKAWCSFYPEDIFENQFELLTTQWKKGLDILEKARSLVKDEEKAEFEDVENVAKASYCHLRSTCLQIRFVRARNNGYDKKIMAECAKEELKLAVELHHICRRDSRIGFEASNHYLYTLNDLREKVLNCRYILKMLERND